MQVFNIIIIFKSPYTCAVLQWTRIGRNVIVKNADYFYQHSAKMSLENLLPLPRNRPKFKIISLSLT